jgi:hypothetical protein
MGKKTKLALVALAAAGIVVLVVMRMHESHRTGNLENLGGFVGNAPGPLRGTIPGQGPLRIGESLSYRVSWSTFATAASATISVPNRLYFFGNDVWDFRAQVSTVNPVRGLFTIDDQFTSYADVRTLESRQYVMRLSELGRNRIQQFRAAEAGSTGGSGFGTIPAGASDPLSALFLLRASDWTRPVQAAIFDGKQTYEMMAQRVAEEPIAVPAGKFDASRIKVELRQMDDKNTHAGPAFGLTIWLAADDYRTPVAIQVALPFGSLRLELTSRNASR